LRTELGRDNGYSQYFIHAQRLSFTWSTLTPGRIARVSGCGSRPSRRSYQPARVTGRASSSPAARGSA